MTASISKIILFCLLFFLIGYEEWAVAVPVPGGKSSKSRARTPPAPGRMDAGPSMATRPQYRLHNSLFTNPIPDTQYQMYVDEVTPALRRLGYFNIAAGRYQFETRELPRFAGAVRAQMASDPRKKKFIPLFADRRGLSGPKKVYAMPLAGRDYARGGLGDYQGVRGEQKVALLGTFPSRDPAIGPPWIELFGVASVSGAPKLHTDIPKRSSRDLQTHNLAEFLDLENVAHNVPEPVRQVAFHIATA
ncbi:hypothetical protein PSEUBRA_003424 [Kalmanozyma brasiliensis GHG001]|uniref:Uncharacterized protein n=1 Tax=Kalmanozyma brasiliensis (strain GHG001) TaxID=1365824 RepID=V5EVH2_KALBG|nr:uncharacterized protein PSEUBRA_003424 [Kalmanozyma brasiliensis GHG001]EST07248.1 hypothetical protein PSEUBRA_003424 [Kalmanozyma brasiliensis GHG001]